MKNNHMKEATKNWIGLGVMVAASAALIAGSTGIYRSISRIGRPISDVPIYTPGEYIGEARGYGGPIVATVEVTDREILSIQAEGKNETPEIGGQAIANIPLVMLKRQTADVDSVSGATASSEGLMTAVHKALAQAKGEEYTEDSASQEFVMPEKLRDGEYEYMVDQPDSNGYRSRVMLTVENGVITACNWDAQAEDGTWKSQLSMDGSYVMTEDGLKWHEQAEALAGYVIENQTLDGLENGNGYTDVVSGVSINIQPFIDGVEECLMQAAESLMDIEEPEVLLDGEYSYEDEEFDSMGYKNMITMTVENGAITYVSWDAKDQNGETKSQLSAEGRYVMTEAGLTWDKQAEALAQYVIENQTVTGLADENGYTDAVSGVSINVFPFVNGIRNCMVQAAE